MTETKPFNVYNASAGSGKTFALVKEYLKLLFASKRPDLFRNILALTFTNKAVGEMKTRIIEKLKLFSEEAILTESDDTFDALCTDLSIDRITLHNRSKLVLNTILHNYAAFDVSTIDKFTHRVIRTFAFDLKIPVNFEVELDTDSLLSEAVDSLISKAGTDRELTKALVDFAIEKADDDKSWDISFDFNKIAKLLVNENDIPFIEKFKDKTLDDFNRLKTLLKTQLSTTEKQIVEKAKEVLRLIGECGLEHNDFSGRNGYVPSYFLKLSKKNTKIDYDKVWIAKIETHSLYPKTTDASIASIIDEIQPQIVAVFYKTKQLVIELNFLKNFYKNITPLSVLNAINSELKDIKADKNVLLISEFNNTIYNEIKDQPTPFIYERLGEKFKHYFIDEFQDTSELQWENLIPLLGNSLSTENGSAMIVGDAKQAIYRWRGGKPELFIDLFTCKNPFQVEKEIHNLPTNYRSCRQIIDFNNGFFKYVSSFAFQKEEHKKLYEASYQDKFINEEGYVNLQFLEIAQEDDRDQAYLEAVYKKISAVLDSGFQPKDICILIRKKKDGVAIANYLSDKELPIISSETLLVNNSQDVQLVINILKLCVRPENYDLKVDVLYQIAEKLNIEDRHSFIIRYLKSDFQDFSLSLKDYGIDFSFDYILQNSLYNASEYIIERLGLIDSSDAYIQFFLDVILEFSRKHSINISDFLEYWEDKKEQLSITSPEGKNAVQIMTIHKSKGLEFPVVIFPYADLYIYREKEPKIWFKLDDNSFNGFPYALLNYTKDISEINEEGKQIHAIKQSQLELDNINLLYVVLTRAVEQLYIISKKDKPSKPNDKAKTYSQFFTCYLKSKGLWLDHQLEYSFGNSKKSILSYSKPVKTITQERFISNIGSDTFTIVAKSASLWETEQEQAIERGNIIHYIMSKIYTPKDIDFAISEALSEGVISAEQIKVLKPDINKIVTHPRLSHFFSGDHKIYNEKDIITKHGSIIRPDRLVIDNQNNATIIDYKTGSYKSDHESQLHSYEEAIKDIPLNVDGKILIYINDNIEVKEL